MVIVRASPATAVSRASAHEGGNAQFLLHGVQQGFEALVIRLQFNPVG